jgi:hypothetical protein
MRGLRRIRTTHRGSTLCCRGVPAIKLANDSRDRQIRACPAMFAFGQTGHRADIAE